MKPRELAIFLCVQAEHKPFPKDAKEMSIIFRGKCKSVQQAYLIRAERLLKTWTL